MTYNSLQHIFPGQCAKYLENKFKMHTEITVRELIVVLRYMGIETIKVYSNGKSYSAFLKKEINNIKDYEFIENLIQYRKSYRNREEWGKEEKYEPPLSNMQNASDELLRDQEVYYTNESKKSLYESIMTAIAKEVKKALK